MTPNPQARTKLQRSVAHRYGARPPHGAREAVGVSFGQLIDKYGYSTYGGKLPTCSLEFAGRMGAYRFFAGGKRALDRGSV